MAQDDTNPQGRSQVGRTAPHTRTTRSQHLVDECERLLEFRKLLLSQIGFGVIGMLPRAVLSRTVRPQPIDSRR